MNLSMSEVFHYFIFLFYGALISVYDCVLFYIPFGIFLSYGEDNIQIMLVNFKTANFKLYMSREVYQKTDLQLY